MTEAPNTETTTTVIRMIFQDQSDAIVTRGNTVLVSHFGSFSQNLVGSLSEGVENLLISIGDKRMVVKRMFSILIEALQNIRIHGELDNSKAQTGFLILSHNPERYRLSLANIIKSENSNSVSEYINRINGYTDGELKELYSSTLSNEFLSAKGGAGLGLITTRMKSGNPLDFELVNLDGETDLFILHISLSRI